jgi:hypothetical protein
MRYVLAVLGLGKFYRLGAIVRLPRDPNAEEDRSTRWRP